MAAADDRKVFGEACRPNFTCAVSAFLPCFAVGNVASQIPYYVVEQILKETGEVSSFS
jgi:hypothetical protein